MNDRYVERLFRVWSTFYDHPLLQKPFYRRVHAAVLRAVPSDARVIVDLGCGTGQLTADLAARYPRATVIGVDLSREMLGKAQARHPDLVQANVYALPLATGSIDLMTSTISYHWYLEPARALAEIRRVLAPGGRFVLATMTSRIWRGTVAGTRWASRTQHAADLRSAGFDILDESKVRPSVSVFTAAAPRNDS